jgi:hypothetical protein
VTAYEKKTKKNKKQKTTKGKGRNEKIKKKNE